MLPDTLPRPGTVDRPAARPGLAEWALIAAVSLCAMLAPLNSTMIVVALPRTVRDFGVPLSAGGWLITLYLIAMASVLDQLCPEELPLLWTNGGGAAG